MSNKRKLDESASLQVNKRFKPDIEHFSDLPEDILFHTLLFVPTGDLGSVVQVNLKWNKIIGGQRYWEARSEVHWPNIASMKLEDILEGCFVIKNGPEGQPNFAWKRYYCLKAMYEDLVSKDSNDFEVLSKKELGNRVIKQIRSTLTPPFKRNKYLRELLEFFFLSETNYAGRLMTALNSTKPEQPKLLFLFCKKLTRICSEIFPNLKVTPELAMAKSLAARLSWEGLNPTLTKAGPKNISFFRDFVRMTIKFVANDFRRRSLPSFLSFKLYDNPEDISLDAVSDVYTTCNRSIIARSVDHDFYTILYEEISKEFFDAKENEWQRKVSAIEARHLLPGGDSKFGADMLPLVYTAISSPEPELAFTGCTNFVDLGYHYNLPEVLNLDDLIKFLTKLIELTEQMPLSYAVWIIPSFVRSLNPEKSIGVSDELLDKINNSIFNLLSANPPQTCKAIHCLGDLGKTFGSRLTPYLPRYKELLFAMAPLPIVTEDNVHERVLDQYIDLLYKSGNISEAEKMISDIMTTTLDNAMMQFFNAYSGLRNAILAQNNTEWIERIIDSILSIFRFNLLPEVAVELIPENQLKWLPKTEKEWLEIRKEISDAISNNEIYQRRSTKAGDGVYISPPYYLDEELDNLGTKGRKAMFSLIPLALKFEKEFKKYYPETLNILHELLQRHFPTYEDQELILGLLKHFIENSTSEEIVAVDCSILGCLNFLASDNGEKAGPIFDQVYAVLIDTELDSDCLGYMITYLSRYLDVSRIIEVIRKHPLESRKAIKLSNGGFIRKKYMRSQNTYNPQIAELCAAVAVIFGLRPLFVDVLQDHVNFNADNFKSWAKEQGHLALPYAKKFAILLAASEVDVRMFDFCEYTIATDFDWSIFTNALSSDKFDTLDEELNNLVKNSDKSIKFWMSLE